MKLKVAEPARAYEQTARAKSTEETGRRIVEAFVGRLMAQWYDEVTLDALAADAGVTVMTVVRRFGGKDGLLAAAVRTIGAGIKASREVPAGDVDAAVNAVVGDYERTGDMVLRMLALEGRHPAVKAVTDVGRTEHRAWVAAVFAGEIKAMAAPGARQRAVDAMVVATDVYTWKLLRRDMGRSVAGTKVVMRGLMRGAIGGG